MQFSQVIGNGEIKALLAQMVDNDRLPHAILFSEDGSWGALAVAIALAQYVNCENPSGGDSCGVCDSCHKYGKLIHPDLHFVFPVAAWALHDYGSPGMRHITVYSRPGSRYYRRE